MSLMPNEVLGFRIGLFLLVLLSSSVVFFFERNKLWAICDKGINDAAILELTKRINGGTHGLEDRKEKTYKYYQFVK